MAPAAYSVCAAGVLAGPASARTYPGLLSPCPGANRQTSSLTPCTDSSRCLHRGGGLSRLDSVHPTGQTPPTGSHLQPSRVLTGLPWPSTGSGTWEGLCPVTPVSSVTSPVTPFLVARPPPTALPIFPSGRPHPCPACVVCPGQPAPRPVAYLSLRPKYTLKQFVCQTSFAPISALKP